jgi:menaquinone-9 beta-reductase
MTAASSRISLPETSVRALGPTLDLDAAADRLWDVIVVGAGPAGSLATRELARSGLKVLLLDSAKFPRYKVCGCYLNGNALGTLAEVGLGDLLAGCNPSSIHHFQIGVRGRQARFALPGGVLLSREALDTALIASAIASGGDFLPESRADLEELGENMRWLCVRQGPHSKRVAARVVLAADGLGGRLLARSGISENRPRLGSRMGIGAAFHAEEAFFSSGTIFMACSAMGYLGVERLEDGRLDMAGAFDVSAVRRVGGPSGIAARVLDEVGWPQPHNLSDQAWRGTLPLTRSAEHTAAERVFAIGDAAAYVEPFTGEGIAWALASAAAVTPLVVRACQRWDDSLAQGWSQSHRRLVGRRQIVCRTAASILRHQRLARLTVNLLRFAPILARPVIAKLNAHAA